MLELSDQLMELSMQPVVPCDDAGVHLMVCTSHVSGTDAERLLSALSEGHPSAHLVGDDLWGWGTDLGYEGFIRRSGGALQLVASGLTRHQALEDAVCSTFGLDAPRLRSFEDFVQVIERWVAEGRVLPWLRQDPQAAKGFYRWFTDCAGAWLDVPMAVLGDRTPREAARTPSYRAPLEAILGRFESLARAHAAESPEGDVQRLRVELGLGE